jgi:hypothetical protein
VVSRTRAVGQLATAGNNAHSRKIARAADDMRLEVLISADLLTPE